MKREKYRIENEIWDVKPDEENRGKHPLHDSRYIVRENGDIVCSLRDQSTQAVDAKCLAAAPQLMKALKLHLAFLKSLPYGWLGKTTGDVGLLNEAYIASREAIVKVEKP